MQRCKWLVAIVALAIGSALLPACRRTEPEAAVEAHGHAEEAGRAHQNDEHDSHAHEELPRRVTVSKEVIAAAGIQAHPVARAALLATLSMPGEVAGDPDRLARISSPSAGRIESVLFAEGQTVKRGAALVVIRVPEIAKLRAASAASMARARAARADAARLRRLLAEKLAVEQDVLNAESEADALELDARSTSDQLGALGAGATGAFSITLRAPLAGAVVMRDAVVGQPVSAEQVLGTIADLSEVWFLARVFEKDLGLLEMGASAEVHLNAYANEHFTGVVEYIGQQIDPIGRTVTARVRLKNPQGLMRIGLFGTCQVAMKGAALEKTEKRLVVEQSSVTEIGGKKVVFVRDQETVFELHEVTLGREALGKVEVLEGLKDGEQVVTDGVFNLKSLVLKESFADEGH